MLSIRNATADAEPRMPAPIHQTPASSHELLVRSIALAVEEPDVWDQIGEVWLRQVPQQLIALSAAHPDHRFYVVVLHGPRCRPNQQLDLLPMVAVNSEQSAQACGFDQDRAFESDRWKPTGFAWPRLSLASNEFESLQTILDKATRLAAPRRLEHNRARYRDVMIDVARQLAETLPTLLPTTADFVVYLSDPTPCPTVARRTIHPETFERLFPEQGLLARQRQAVAALPLQEQAEFYIGRLGANTGIRCDEAQQALIALGSEATRSLVNRLAEPLVGPIAARLLGAIQHRSDGIITALRQRVLSRGAAADWSSRALAQLGDLEFLLGLASDDKTARFACSGLSAPLLDSFPEGTALDYGPIARLLDRHPELHPMVEAHLDSGGDPCPLEPRDVPAALGGLTHAHPLIRHHAARLLGSQRLGHIWTARVLEGLVLSALRDRDARVRQASLIAIAQWNSWGRPYHRGLHPLLDDPDQGVQTAAKSLLRADPSPTGARSVEPGTP